MIVVDFRMLGLLLLLPSSSEDNVKETFFLPTSLLPSFLIMTDDDIGFIVG
jgi:hypothetical protein